MESPVRPVKPVCAESLEQTRIASNDAVPAAPAPTPAASSPFAHKPPRPIGPAAMKALREAIRSGAYPSDDVVRRGLERLIRRPD